MRTESLSVIGMKCSGCVEKITKALMATDGVQSVTVSLEAGTVALSYDEQATGLGQLRARINKLGYGIDDLKSPHGKRGCRCEPARSAVGA